MQLNLQTLNLDTAINSIEFLVDLALPKGVLFDDLEEKNLIKAHKYACQSRSLWLKHLAGKKALSPEAVFTNQKYFQPHAELDNALLNLALGLHARIPQMQAFWHGENGATTMWFQALLIEQQKAFEGVGLLGKAEGFGKNEFYNRDSNLLDKFNEGSTEGCFSDQQNMDGFSHQLTFADSPETYLTTLGEYTARLDDDFLSEYWHPYYRSAKRWKRKLKDCKELQVAFLLPNRKLFVTGDNRKIPPSIKTNKSKGFGSGL